MEDINNTIDSLITDYFEGKCSEEELTRLFEWVNHSDENRQYFLKLRNIWHNVSPQFDPEDIDVDKAEMRLLRRTRIKTGPIAWFKKFLNVWTKAAAVLLLPAIGLAVFFALTNKSTIKENDIILSTKYGCNIETDLPDGSHVWLNANSQLSYSPDFIGKERSVKLSGEAYFDVKADKENPFTVVTDVMTVTATGTEFNVNAYSGYSNTDIILTEGKVNVGIGNVNYPLSPGEVLSFKDGEVSTAELEDIDRAIAWREGRLIFDGESLAQILTRLSQIYNVEYEIKDPKVADIPFRASFNGETVSEILQLLQLTAPIKCEIKESENENHTTVIVYAAN